MQHGRLPLWRPCATAVRPLAQSACVDEDDRAPLGLGFFLISGHRFCFQHWIAASSRSRARPVGRWHPHPICRRMRRACPGWHCTPHSVSVSNMRRGPQVAFVAESLRAALQPALDAPQVFRATPQGWGVGGGARAEWTQQRRRRQINDNPLTGGGRQNMVN